MSTLGPPARPPASFVNLCSIYKNGPCSLSEAHAAWPRGSPAGQSSASDKDLIDSQPKVQTSPQL